ncbi:hypothetical protein OG894_41730 [Streptomyces sp. NBC_01724]|uniref:hypothetical protein n=1 Tax=unclassified Streptomyces TaxID=2593676 RepID=UPI002E30BE9E|nr:hypothetical protein [Streptomyces sp. NBC_01724]WTE49251.1 hypothetical protein OG987_00060 [Streptomyces sp. NBC_01620]WTE56747.1 hypothetical protein OG987_42610 [Streptomyces sp. NBC_01620]
MTHQALPTQLSATTASHRPSVPTTGPAIPAKRSRLARFSSKLPRMSELAIDTGDAGRVIDLRRQPDAASRLPRGKARGRYRCCACGGTLIFSGPATPTSGFTPRFRHDGSTPGSDLCTAPAPHQADIQADLTVVLHLRDQLVHALPGASICLQIDPQLAGQHWPLPPALIVRRGNDVIVIERPRRLLTTAATEVRLRTVRNRHGENVKHWWFFDRADTLHYDPAGTVSVRPHGKPLTHYKVRPTPTQRQIIAAGGAVCWITKDTVLIPYGGHLGTYPVQEGEDWSGELESWSRDWKISYPYPADTAAWWGLVPVPLLAFGTHTGFRPAPAFHIMTALAAAERGREKHRRSRARTHAQRPTTAQHHAPASQENKQTSPTTPPEPPAPTDNPEQNPHPTTAPTTAPIPPQPAGPPLHVPTQPYRFHWRSLLPRRRQS